MPCQKAPRVFLNNKKLGCLENDLSQDEIEWLCQFMDRLNSTCTNVRGKRSIMRR